MAPHFHIFKCESDGTVIWREAVETLEIARTRVQVLAESCPGIFIVFNPATGQKISIAKGGGTAPAHKSAA